MRFIALLCAAVAWADTGALDPEVGFVGEPTSFGYVVNDHTECLIDYVTIAADPDYSCSNTPAYDADTGTCEFTCDLQVRVTPDE